MIMWYSREVDPIVAVFAAAAASAVASPAASAAVDFRWCLEIHFEIHCLQPFSWHVISLITLIHLAWQFLTFFPMLKEQRC